MPKIENNHKLGHLIININININKYQFRIMNSQSYLLNHGSRNYLWNAVVFLTENQFFYEYSKSIYLRLFVIISIIRNYLGYS